MLMDELVRKAIRLNQLAAAGALTASDYALVVDASQWRAVEDEMAGGKHVMVKRERSEPWPRIAGVRVVVVA